MMRLGVEFLAAGALVLIVAYFSIIQSTYKIYRLPFSIRGTTEGDGQHAPNLFRQTVMAPTVAVVGTGLAGLSAAYELSRILHAELPDARIIVFEKNPMLGGNSMKASSGINAVNQAAGDTRQIYAGDTIKSGGGLSKEDLVAQLVVSPAQRSELLC